MRRILVVEDSPTQARELELILVGEGFDVTVAADGEQAFNLFLSSDFDLVLTDILMPGLSGYDLCRRIKAHPTRQQTPVILLTTLNDPLDIVRGIECGADNYLTKPCHIDTLLDRICYIFTNKALREESRFQVGIGVTFLGERFTVTSGREQILDLLLSTCEDVVRANRELRASQADLATAKAQLEQYTRRIEGQARSLEDKYRRLMEGANDAIFILDPQGRVLEVNRRAVELLGRPASEIIGSSYEQFVPPAERTVEREKFQRLLAEGTARRDDAGIVRVDGRLALVDYSASLVDLDGERVILTILHDVTEHRRLEEQFRQVQKMEAIGQLAGGLVHDFNNLLTIITGYGQLMLRSLGAEDPTREFVNQILKAGDQAASLTRQLLAFSRQQVLAPQILDLNSVVTGVDRMLRRMIGEDIQLTSALDPNLGRVKVDPGQVEQVLLNLAVNARDAMPQGGRLTLETANIELDEEYTRSHPEVQPGYYVLLAVSDTGCGMDEATRARIFEPFFTTKEKGKGTGLGLATVYGIVKQSGGSVSVYSEPGQGATFKIYLPRVEAPLSEAKSPTIPPQSLSGTETILLVEDEAAVRKIVRDVLQSNGYQVLEANNGAEAIQLAEHLEAPIHLLVTDVVMPEMGGRQLADCLTARRPTLKTIYLSGYTDDAVVRHGVLEADVAFLQKPFSVDALIRTVRAVLDQEAALQH